MWCRSKLQWLHNLAWHGVGVWVGFRIERGGWAVDKILLVDWSNGFKIITTWPSVQMREKPKQMWIIVIWIIMERKSYYCRRRNVSIYSTLIWIPVIVNTYHHILRYCLSGLCFLSGLLPLLVQSVQEFG